MTIAAIPPLAADPVVSPWWRVGMAWLAVGLPASAVVAATLSAVIAIRGADPVVDEYKNAARQAAEESADHGPLTANPRQPAELARNTASLHR